jgi:hypothetical protein
MFHVSYCKKEEEEEEEEDEYFACVKYDLGCYCVRRY